MNTKQAHKDITGAILPVIDTDQCIYLLEAFTVDQFYALFKVLRERASIQIIVGAALDDECEFSKNFNEVTVVSKEVLRVFTKGSYTLCSNNVVIITEGEEQPCIYSCSGTLKLWDHQI